MSERRPPPSECAQCGAAIPPRASACPECGADERTGWREASIYDGMDLPESAWSDDTNEDTRPSEAAGAARRSRDVNGVRWYWWCAGVALLLVLCLGALALL